MKNVFLGTVMLSIISRFFDAFKKVLGHGQLSVVQVKSPRNSTDAFFAGFLASVGIVLRSPVEVIVHVCFPALVEQFVGHSLGLRLK